MQRANYFPSTQARQIIIEQSRRANVGHIGSALSVVDLVSAIYSSMTIKTVDDQDRDRFILSKGHSALALYAVLFLNGVIDQETLFSFCQDGGSLGTHPERRIIGVDFSTGSLGHGLSIGAGAALGAKLKRSSRRIFVLLSDAECNEGSVWEAIMFANHHKLSHLIAIVDLNGQQALGYTNEVLSLDPMRDRWHSFGWNVKEINGHDINLLKQTIDSLDTHSEKPHVIIANTTFGKGISFMEKQIKWHYSPMSQIEYKQALKELSG